MRLKGVGRSPLSDARVGLLAVGPERDHDRVRGQWGGGRERKETMRTKSQNKH